MENTAEDNQIQRRTKSRPMSWVDIVHTTVGGDSTTTSPGIVRSDSDNVYRQIEELVCVHEGQSTIAAVVITRRHWKIDENKTCSNRVCKKKFSLVDRQHHCRRCGEIFCDACTKWRRKLNHLANPDPDGKLYRVCQPCFDEGRHTMGLMRRRTFEFHAAKEALKAAMNRMEAGHRDTTWKGRFNMNVECRRLIDGFRNSFSSSELKRTLHDMKNIVKTPAWQKSSFWLQEKLSPKCQFCLREFGLLKKKIHCRVCGICCCADCSTKDLIIYFPDGVDVSPSIEPQLAIIKFVGCPEKEPEICLYLPVCQRCNQRLVDIQVERVESNSPKPEADMLTRLNVKQEQFHELTVKIDQHLIDYQDIIDSLENNSTSSLTVDGKSRNNMKTLAKAQGDLSDFFTQYVMFVQQLKTLKPSPESSVQRSLLRNFIKSKCDFYLENVSGFRSTRSKLAAVSPPEVLELIQRMIDKDSIISTHLYMRQLVFEALHLTDKYNVMPNLPRTLLGLEQVVENEAEKCLQREGEEWMEHQQLVNKMLQAQIKEHKLIRPSKTLIKAAGARHIRECLSYRSNEIFQQLRLQLVMKSAHKSFQATKSALQEASTRKNGDIGDDIADDMEVIDYSDIDAMVTK